MVKNLYSFIASVIISISPALADSDTNAFPQFSKLSVNCTIEGDTHFQALQTTSIKDKIFDLKFGDCNVTVKDNGSTTIEIDTSVELATSGEVKFCSSFSTALLFEVSSTSPSISWPSQRILIEDLDIENIYGDRKTLGLFHLHSSPSSENSNLNDLFGSLNGMPRFDNLFWGSAVVLQANSQSEFVREVRSKLPLSDSEGGTPELIVDMAIRAYLPRGLCSYRTGEANDSGEEEQIAFQVAKK